MQSLGLGEILMIAALVLVFVGPERLPHATRTLGRMYAQLRRAADDLRRALVIEADRLDEVERLEALRRRREEDAARRAAEARSADDPVAAPAPAHEAPIGAPVDDDPPPAGFSPEEWRDVPPHLRARIRGATTPPMGGA
jgi:sec-independent protein translocase protein TatB